MRNDLESTEGGQYIKAALACLDRIIFLPISSENRIDYTEENPAYRKAADRYFKRKLRHFFRNSRRKISPGSKCC